MRGGSRDFKGGVHNLLLIQVSFFQWFFEPHMVKHIKSSLRLLHIVKSTISMRSMLMLGVWRHALHANFEKIDALKCYLKELLSIAILYIFSPNELN